MTVLPHLATVKAHLHADSAARPDSYITAVELQLPAPDVVINGEHIYRLEPDATRRLRRPTYVRATYAITGPVARRAGVAPAVGR
jgi:hypothetical protein